MLNYADSKVSSDALLHMNRQGVAMNGVNQGNEYRYNKYALDVERNGAMTNAFANMSGSLGMAYAYGKAGQNPTAPKTPTKANSKIFGYPDRLGKYYSSSLYGGQ